jgi:phytoene synthase
MVEDKSISNLEIFRKGSQTYFTSSLFFSPRTRNRIAILYAFVRVCDDLVDHIPQKKDQFYDFVKQYYDCKKGESIKNSVVKNYVNLETDAGFDPKWTEAFLKSMEWDLTQKSYNTMTELEEYIYGSADVIGLFMCQILGISKEAHKYAMHLGKSMQYINFIRDINEDFDLGRIYIPAEFINKYGIKSFDRKSLHNEENKHFENLIKNEIERFFVWQKEAEKGFGYIPIKYRIPIATASDMYKWTAKQIKKNPSVVLQKKVKPSTVRILWSGFVNTMKYAFLRM